MIRKQEENARKNIERRLAFCFLWLSSVGRKSVMNMNAWEVVSESE